MNIADILVHISNALDDDQRRDVVKSLREMDGVISSRFVSNKDRFMMLAFNPEKVKSLGLLAAFDRAGLQARLIGM